MTAAGHGGVWGLPVQMFQVVAALAILSSVVAQFSSPYLWGTVDAAISFMYAKISSGFS